MKTPFFMGIIYSVMGALFTYLAIQSIDNSIWNFTTILLMIVATFDFVVAIRFLFMKK